MHCVGCAAKLGTTLKHQFSLLSVASHEHGFTRYNSYLDLQNSVVMHCVGCAASLLDKKLGTTLKHQFSLLSVASHEHGLRKQGRLSTRVVIIQKIGWFTRYAKCMS